MARIGPPSREAVPADRREVFVRSVSERGGLPPSGPLATMLNAPEMLERGEHLSAYLRGDSTDLSAMIRELAMLDTARENDYQYIWHARATAGWRPRLNDESISQVINP